MELAHIEEKTQIITTRLLDDMPALPTRFGFKPLIATKAEITYTVVDNGSVVGPALVFYRLDLTGVQPLKDGTPSKAPNSDRYWDSSMDNESMPQEYVELVAKTALHLLERMKGLSA